MPDQNVQPRENSTVKKEPLTKVSSETDEKDSTVYSNNLMSRADTQVRENEDASLQDESYAFDEDNTDNEEYHDVDDVDLADVFESDDDLQ